MHFEDVDVSLGREYMCSEADRWVVAHHDQGRRAPSLEGEQRFLVRVKRGFPTDFNPAGDDRGGIRVRHLATQTICILFYRDGIQTFGRKRSGFLVTDKVQILS